MLNGYIALEALTIFGPAHLDTPGHTWAGVGMAGSQVIEEG